jgi:hypothetical protein
LWPSLNLNKNQRANGDDMTEHGGSRVGAGRRKGSLNRRSADLIDRLKEMGVDPAIKLAELALKAQSAGDDDLALEANKALLPYTYAKLRVIDADVTAASDLGERLAAARSRVQAMREERAALEGPSTDTMAPEGDLPENGGGVGVRLRLKKPRRNS